MVLDKQHACRMSDEVDQLIFQVQRLAYSHLAPLALTAAGFYSEARVQRLEPSETGLRKARAMLEAQIGPSPGEGDLNARMSFRTINLLSSIHQWVEAEIEEVDEIPYEVKRRHLAHMLTCFNRTLTQLRA